MDEKYKVVIRYKFHKYMGKQISEVIFEFDTLTEAIAKFNEVLEVGRDIDYVKIIWGDTEIQCYEFE